MLILKQGGIEVQRVGEGGWFALPNGDVVSPAYAGWEEQDFSLVEAPPEPEPTPEEVLATERAGMRLSFAQLLIGLVTEGWITAAEGRAWRDRVALPAPVAAMIASLPEAQQFAAETRAFAPSEVLRNDPLSVSFGAAAGKTPTQMDAFFTTYASV